MKPLIYIVEDDKDSQGLIKDLLTRSDYLVQTFEKGSVLLKALEKTKPDLIILDLILPDIDGESLCTDIRKTFPDLPIVILTSKSSTAEKVQGLNLGADDYVTKPFNSEELLARIKTRLRRTNPTTKTLKIADLEMDLDRIEVKRDGKMIPLTPQEFKLLKYLIENKGVVLSRDMILNRIWDYSLEVESRVVDVYMGYLRKKLDINSPRKLIKSVRGFGYTIKD
jgi:two-component system alkaline phosphatase synthesis response regulator PhoP